MKPQLDKPTWNNNYLPEQVAGKMTEMAERSAQLMACNTADSVAQACALMKIILATSLNCEIVTKP